MYTTEGKAKCAREEEKIKRFFTLQELNTKFFPPPKLFSPADPVPARRNYVYKQDPVMLHSIELQSYCKEMEFLFKQALKKKTYRTNTPDWLPPVPALPDFPKSCNEAGSVVQREDRELSCNEERVHVYAPISLPYENVQKLIRRAIATVLCQVGYDGSPAGILCLLTNAVEGFLRKFMRLLHCNIERDHKLGNSGFSSPLERTLHEMGIHGISALKEFYVHKVIDVYKRLLCRAQDLHDDYSRVISNFFPKGRNDPSLMGYKVMKKIKEPGLFKKRKETDKSSPSKKRKDAIESSSSEKRIETIDTISKKYKEAMNPYLKKLKKTVDSHPKTSIEKIDLWPKNTIETKDLYPEKPITIDLYPKEQIETVDLCPKKCKKTLDSDPKKQKETMDLNPKKQKKTMGSDPKKRKETMVSDPKKRKETIDLPPKKQKKTMGSDPKRRKATIDSGNSKKRKTPIDSSYHKKQKEPMDSSCTKKEKEKTIDSSHSEKVKKSTYSSRSKKGKKSMDLSHSKKGPSQQAFLLDNGMGNIPFESSLTKEETIPLKTRLRNKKTTIPSSPKDSEKPLYTLHPSSSKRSAEADDESLHVRKKKKCAAKSKSAKKKGKKY